MSKHLFLVSYTAEGARGLLKEGGTARVAYMKSLAERHGAKIESFYWAFGEDDAYVIVDGNDNAGAAALSLAVTASGASRVKTVVLLTPEEIDAAAKEGVDFRAPGA
jgi:uncharacterized protein with GYD domain